MKTSGRLALLGLGVLMLSGCAGGYYTHDSSYSSPRVHSSTIYYPNTSYSRPYYGSHRVPRTQVYVTSPRPVHQTTIINRQPVIQRPSATHKEASRSNQRPRYSSPTQRHSHQRSQREQAPRSSRGPERSHQRRSAQNTEQQRQQRRSQQHRSPQQREQHAGQRYSREQQATGARKQGQRHNRATHNRQLTERSNTSHSDGRLSGQGSGQRATMR